MKAFSLDEYLERPGRKVATRSGIPVRIICTDNRGSHGDSGYPVIALVRENPLTGAESIREYDRDGKVFRVYGTDPHDLDLVFDDTSVPAPDRCKRRISWVNIFADGRVRYPGSLFETREAAEESRSVAARSGAHPVTTVSFEWAEDAGTDPDADTDTDTDTACAGPGISRKRFTLAEYRKDPSRKVTTRAGLPARIICTDRSAPEEPVIALVGTSAGEGGSEHIVLCSEDGAAAGCGKSPFDLFFAPAVKTGWMNLYCRPDGWVYTGNRIFETVEEAERKAARKAAESDAMGLPGHCTTVKLEWEE